nr:PREDICTED: uncharacterized protein LOC108951679 [Musa acuminata subsp. malaccensis]
MRQMGWDEGEALAKTSKAFRTASKGDDADQIKSRQDALEHDVVNEGTKKRREGEDCESILGRPSRNSWKQTEENCLNDLDPPIEHPFLVADPHVPQVLGEVIYFNVLSRVSFSVLLHFHLLSCILINMYLHVDAVNYSCQNILIEYMFFKIEIGLNVIL